jgi:hypothetical protein
MNINKKNYNKTERLLKEYPLLLVGIEDVKKQIAILEFEDGIRGVRYDSPSVKTSNISNVTERTALDKIEAIDRLNKQKEYFKLKCERIDGLLKMVDERGEKVIRGFYFEGKHWEGISYDIGYSSRQAKRVRTEVISKIASILFYHESGLEDAM